jgi:cytochrome c-type biogenesis protein CcmH/NrfF
LNWLVYVLPPVAFLIGAYVVFRSLRTWRRAAASASVAHDTPMASDDPYVRRLEDELRRRG